MKLLFAIALLAPVCANAAGPFDGTWKTQLDSFQFSSKPSIFQLKQGTYTCTSCVPHYSVRADGTDQKIPAHGYYDSIAAKSIDERTVQVEGKLGGKPAFANTMVVSADKSTLTTSFKDMSGTQVMTGKQVMIRVGAGAAGSHAISGSWKSERLSEMSDVGALVTYRMTADGMRMEWNGQTYDAKFDGKKVLTANDPGKTWVSLRRVAGNTIDETDSRDGRVVETYRMTVSADGKTMTVVDKDVLRGSTSTYKMIKQ